MPRSCCTPFSSSPGTASPSTTSSSSASGAARRRGIPKCISPTGSRSPPVPWARVSATASAWASPSAGSGRASVPSSSTTTPSSSAATGTSWRASATRRRRSPGISGWAGSSTSTTTTTSPSTAPPSSPTPTTWPSRFDAYGWHTDNIGEVANDTDALEAALRRAMAVEDQPSMILLRSHIGWPSPHKTDTADAHGSPLGEDEVRETKAILGLPPDETFWVPDEVIDFYRRGAGRGEKLDGEWQAAPRRLGRGPGGVGRVPARPGPRGLVREASRVRGRHEPRHPGGGQPLHHRHRRGHPRP